MDSLDTWLQRVRGAVRLREPEDGPKIAQMCQDAEVSGDNPTVWHNTAKYYGTTCHCRSCDPK
jgi:hypothetical protein